MNGCEVAALGVTAWSALLIMSIPPKPWAGLPWAFVRVVAELEVTELRSWKGSFRAWLNRMT